MSKPTENTNLVNDILEPLKLTIDLVVMHHSQFAIFVQSLDAEIDKASLLSTGMERPGFNGRAGYNGVIFVTVLENL
jgi:hypothetical protein